MASMSSTIQAGSPTASRFTDQSTSHAENGQYFSELPMPRYAVYPAHAARLNPSHSANDMPSLAQLQKSSGPAKSQSMIFTAPGGPSAQVSPQPPLMHTSTFQTQMPQPLSPALPRTDSIVNMDGSEPRMFPGVVMNRNRRSSVQARPDTSDGAGSGQSWGRRSEVGEAVLEEVDGELGGMPTSED
jgi:AMP deaminase